jgi:hypothetical protein
MAVDSRMEGQLQQLLRFETDVWGNVVPQRSHDSPRTPPGFIRESYTDGMDSDGDDLANPTTRDILVPDPNHPRGQRALRQEHAGILAFDLAQRISCHLGTSDGKWKLADILQGFLYEVMCKRGWFLGVQPARASLASLGPASS